MGLADDRVILENAPYFLICMIKLSAISELITISKPAKVRAIQIPNCTRPFKLQIAVGKTAHQYQRY